MEAKKEENQRSKEIQNSEHDPNRTNTDERAGDTPETKKTKKDAT